MSKVFTNLNYPEVQFKSKEELYFSYFIDELSAAGFIKSWGYEVSKFELSKPVVLNYVLQMKTKTKSDTIHLAHGATCTSDFTIEWDASAIDIFVLRGITPVTKDRLRLIPFYDMLGKSEIEIKPESEFMNSSVSFPYKQKWVLDKHGVLIQKIKPFGKKGKGTLFDQTFYPAKVLAEETYKVNTKQGKIGESKLKFKTRTLKEFLELIKSK